MQMKSKAALAVNQLFKPQQLSLSSPMPSALLKGSEEKEKTFEQCLRPDTPELNSSTMSETLQSHSTATARSIPITLRGPCARVYEPSDTSAECFITGRKSADCSVCSRSNQIH